MVMGLMSSGAMFAARGIAVSLSVFAVVYCGLSLAVGAAWRHIHAQDRGSSARRAADILFTLRMLPVLCAVMVTAALTVPSFLLLEPRSIEEPLGGVPLVLGFCGAALMFFGVVKAAMAVRHARRAISSWTRDARPLETFAAIPVLGISRALPAMIAAGIFRPRVLLSGTAQSLLSASEMRTALNHEVAHVRRRDNLRKLLLQFVAFPGMRALEEAWLEATEMAADDDAVASADEALDLAAALIKLSRLGSLDVATELATELVHSGASAVHARVERLIAWSEKRQAPASIRFPWYGLAALTATTGVFVVTYSHLLAHVHTATEWLVR